MKLASRRQKRLLTTVVMAGCFVVVLATVFALRPKPSDYVPGEKVEGLTEALGRNVPPDCPHVNFVDATERAGIHFRHFNGTRTSQLPEDMGSGAAWGDFDQDGYPDLFLVNEAGPLTLAAAEVKVSPARCALFHNNGDGTFTDVSDAVGLGDVRGGCMGAAWGDYDNDGYPDLFVTAFGHNRLFHNETGPGGSRIFRETTAKAGVGGLQGFWTGASWGDYDRDGRLDLYVCGYVKYRTPTQSEKSMTSMQSQSNVPFTLNPSSYPPERNLLYHNNGDGTFSEVAKQAGVDDPTGKSLSAAWCDFDGDGWPDLYVNNDVSMHAFYRNLRNGKFQDISTSSWACDYRGGMGIAVGDWDNNGDMDMFLTHWIAQENALYHNMLAMDRKKKTTGLHFVDISDQVGLGQSTIDYIGWGTSFLDIDNDGRLDLVMTNGSTFEEPDDRTHLIKMRNQLFWNGCQKSGFFENDANARGFFEVEDISGDALKQPNVGRGLAVADYDRDGAVDLIITRNDGTPLLLHSAGGTSNHWLEIWLKGVRSNRDAIGARIVVAAGGLRQTRVVGATSSYLSQDDLVQHFGLGSTAKVDSIEITWPSGLKQKSVGIDAGRLIRIREGGAPEAMSLRKGAQK